MSDILAEGRWDNTKEALLDGLQGNRRKTMSTILENTKRHLTEAATSGATAAGGVAQLNKVIFEPSDLVIKSSIEFLLVKFFPYLA